MVKQINCDCTVDCDGQRHEINYCEAHEQRFILYNDAHRELLKYISFMKRINIIASTLEKRVDEDVN
jgi:hypothetical protein